MACAGPPEADTPTAAYERLLDELRLGEFGPAMDALLTPQDVALRQRLERELRRTGQELTESIAQIEPVEERIDGRWAIVVTLIERPRGADTTRFVRDEYLYREDGGWKLVPEAIRSDPAVQPLVDAAAQRLFDWYRGHREELEARYAGPGGGDGGE